MPLRADLPRLVTLAALAWAVGVDAQSQPADASRDSRPQPGVPAGVTFKIKLDASKVYPGTIRVVTVYVPDQYRPDTPACVYVGLDGLGADTPVVFDNLIQRHEMPVTIGVGIEPGRVPSARQPENPRVDRSAEFDATDDRLARFVLDEVLAELGKRKTPDGRKILLSQDPDDRAVGGTGAAATAAFTMAWQRPDAFHRVYAAAGTFVAVRDADAYPALVRKIEPKPLRVCLDDGPADAAGHADFGDASLADEAMGRALDFAGYDARRAAPTGGADAKHTKAHAAAGFPDAVQWLWRDWPRPVAVGMSQNTVLKAVLYPGETWTAAADADAPASLTADAGTSFKTHFGDVYAADPAAGRLTFRKAGGQTTVLDDTLKGPSAVAVSPDGLWLAVFERDGHFGYGYRIKPDGTTDAKQRFYWLHAADDTTGAGAAAAVYDREGRLYVATRTGVQVLDRSGRCHAILPVPGGAATAVGFGGVSRNDLFARTAAGVFRRRVKTTGLAPEAVTIELPPTAPNAP